MFEVLKMRLVNRVETSLEKKREEKGYLFVPSDQQTREITEALLIDGLPPSTINDWVIRSQKERTSEHRQALRAHIEMALTAMDAVLRTDGIDKADREFVLEDAKKDLETTDKLYSAKPLEGVRPIDLTPYYD